MGKYRWLKWGLIGGILVVLLQFGTTIEGQAANSGSRMEDVIQDSHFKWYQNPDNPEIVSGGVLDGANFELRRYPTINGISADYVDSGRLTTDTKNIVVDLQGRASVKYVSPKYANFQGLISKYRVVLMTGGNFNGVVTPLSVIAKSNTISTDFANSLSAGFQVAGGYQFPVDLSKLNKLLPIHVGFQLQTTKDHEHWVSYYLGSFTTDGVLEKPTIDDGLKPESTRITGTGMPGCWIRSDVNDATAKVASDGKYVLNLGTDLQEHLLANSKVTITQYNQFGDFSEESQRQLKMSQAENNPAFHIEDDLDYPEGTTDDEIVSDLRQHLGINIDDEQLKVQYRSTKENLAELINSQAMGSTIEIPIYAESPGYIQSNNIVVKITKKQENVIFTNQKSNLYFPNQALPLKKTSIWSDDVWKLSVIDNRVRNKKAWTLTAIAAKPAHASNKYDLSPYLWYADGRQQHRQLNERVTVLDSQMPWIGGGNGSKMFEQEFNQAHGSGIFIKSDPQMPTGAYEATITWTLQMAP